MNKKSITLLIFACIFATIAGVFLFFDAYVSFSAYALVFAKAESFGEALGAVLGGILLYAYTIILGVLVIINSLISLPFSITLMKKEGKPWYALTLLIFAIIAILMAVVFFIMLPIMGNYESAQSSSSSSDAIESASALLLL